MKIIGLIGGLGPESTIDYYEKLIAGHRARTQDDSYPRIVINSLDLTRIVALVSAKKYDELAAELAGEVERLAAAGAAIAAITANTPHVVFDGVERRSRLPLISIVRAARDAAVAAGLHKPALLGTRFTMTGHFYPDVFSESGIALVTPSEAEQEFVHDKYMNELLVGTFSDETRRRFVALIGKMRDRDSIDGAILAGTELPLLLRGERIEGVPLLDTTEIHVNAILAAALE